MKPTTLLPLLPLFLPALSTSTPPLTKRHALKYTSCSADQIQILQNTMADVSSLARAAARESEPANGFPTAWFGENIRSPSNEKINTRFEKMAGIGLSVPVHDVELDCAGTSICCFKGKIPVRLADEVANRGSVAACQAGRGADQIALCRGFWNWDVKQRVYELAPPVGKTRRPIEELGYRGQAYVLLHELTHALWGTYDIVDTVKDEFGKTVECLGYGQRCVLRYAKKNPTNVRRNADTYALFALAAYYGLDKFETNPDLLVG
ncbi:zincin [Polyplosphaeria fusca]|uniref:Zincin n=1 Tax=Polyplosphaeria fusca TaxID=682080 RepID=A0A9P4UVD8_9PLEO|nr:zincin [Polyplosphaeria fusca]